MWYLFVAPIISICVALVSRSWLAGAVSFFLLSLWIGTGIFLIGIPFLSRAVTRIRTDAPLIALTFDDGPHPSYSRQILGILRKHGAHATFFVVAERARQYPEIIDEIISQGHEIGNHSLSHRHLLSLSSFTVQYEDIGAAQEIIEGLSGTAPRLYRPPMGYKTPETFRAAKSLGLRVVGWKIKGWDTVLRDPERIAGHILSRAKRGTIILLHDSSSLKKRFADRSATIDALPLILSGLGRLGLRCVTLSELQNKGR